MDDIRVISSEEDIKIFADINRFAIIDALSINNVLTTKEISEQTGLSYSRVNYSLKKLEEAEIVKVVDTKLKFGIQERYYSLTAKEFRIIPEKKGIDGIEKTINSKLIDEIILKSLSKEYLKNSNTTSNIAVGNVYLTDEEYKIIKEKIDRYFNELLEPYKERVNNEKKPYTISNIFFKRI